MYKFLSAVHYYHEQQITAFSPISLYSVFLISLGAKKQVSSVQLSTEICGQQISSLQDMAVSLDYTDKWLLFWPVDWLCAEYVGELNIYWHLFIKICFGQQIGFVQNMLVSSIYTDMWLLSYVLASRLVVFRICLVSSKYTHTWL